MGDPKRQRKKYETPLHPWQGERILAEKEILKEYGLKNKKEIWKMSSILRTAKTQAKKLVVKESEQAKKEEKLLIIKLARLGLIKDDAKLEDVLGIDIKDILNRRLQTFVYKKGLARSAKQARQFIIHGHIFVNNKEICVPSYLVPLIEEDKITFDPGSKLSSVEHPERTPIKKTGTVKKKPARKRERTDRKERPRKGNKR